MLVTLLKSLGEGAFGRASALTSVKFGANVKYIGAFAAAMNGVDAIVFTAGLGENHVIVRQRVCESLKYLGVTPDINLNEKMTRGNEGKITTENSTVDVYVIPTNEELVIARDVERLKTK